MKKQDVKYFRMDGQTTDPRLTQGYTIRKGCKSDFVRERKVDETFKQPNLLSESILSSVYLIDKTKKYQHLGA